MFGVSEKNRKLFEEERKRIEAEIGKTREMLRESLVRRIELARKEWGEIVLWLITGSGDDATWDERPVNPGTIADDVLVLSGFSESHGENYEFRGCPWPVTFCIGPKNLEDHEGEYCPDLAQWDPGKGLVKIWLLTNSGETVQKWVISPFVTYASEILWRESAVGIGPKIRDRIDFVKPLWGFPLPQGKHAGFVLDGNLDDLPDHDTEPFSENERRWQLCRLIAKAAGLQDGEWV